MKQDDITITILDDGRIKIETNKISPANHTTAQKFLETITQLSGGDVIKQKKSKSHSHNIVKTKKHLSN
jgi:hypothetical protein